MLNAGYPTWPQIYTILEVHTPLASAVRKRNCFYLLSTLTEISDHTNEGSLINLGLLWELPFIFNMGTDGGSNTGLHFQKIVIIFLFKLGLISSNIASSRFAACFRACASFVSEKQPMRLQHPDSLSILSRRRKYICFEACRECSYPRHFWNNCRIAYLCPL